MDVLRKRFGAIQSICHRPWVRWLVLVWVAIGVYDTFAQQLLPKEWAAKAPTVYEVVTMTSGFLPWWGWLLLVMGVVTAAGIEYGVRNSPKKGLVDQNYAESISALQMTIGESGPYLATDGDTNLYRIGRILNLKVENTSRDTNLSRCSVQIMSVEPENEHAGPWQLNGAFPLPPGDHIFIPLVSYGEARDANSYPCGDDFMMMGTERGYPCPDIGREYVVTLRATAPETAYHDFQCKVWIDETGRLRVGGV